VKRRWVAALALAAAASGSACRTPEPAGAPPSHYVEPRWQDAFDVSPKLLATVFPTALRSDKVYGPLLRRVIELARERSRVVAETRALDAMEDAEQIIVGMEPDSSLGIGDVVVVVRGVRADVDPIDLVDADGRALWTVGPAGSVRELVRSDMSAPAAEEAHIPASLFELPGRTWVIASGAARERARRVFAHPLERPPVSFDGGALAVVRIDGPSLVSRVRALQPTGTLADAGRRLEALTLELPPGNDRQVRATLSYFDDTAAGLSEASVREVLEAIGRRKPDGLAWLSSATIERRGKQVVLTAPLPAGLVVGLLHPGGTSLETRPSAP
jgi:hypothetical protein